MKVKTKIKNSYYLIVDIYYIICLILSFIIVFLHENIISTSFAIIITIINSFLMYILYNNYYELKKDYLAISVGPFKKNIKYNDIKKCYITENNLPFAVSSKRITIETQNKIYSIIPEKLDEMLNKLISKKRGEKK